MAIYHLTTKPISRSNGRSATAAAAYRSGERIADLTSGEVFDYTRKRGVEHTEIVLSTQAAKADIQWARDRQALWNAAEAAERRKDARVAREYELAVPHELSRAERIALVREFAAEIADRHQVAVDVAIHKPHRAGDRRNHHAHVLATTRVVEPTGLGAKASMEWSDTDRGRAQLVRAKDELTAIRERWAALANAKLREHGIAERIDHRTLEAQGIDRVPTVHKGVAITGLERRGARSDVGERIDRQWNEASQRRLELAAEQGALLRERAQVESQLLSLSTDIGAALQARNSTPAKPQTLEQQRAAAREAWLAQRSKPPADRAVDSDRTAEKTTDRDTARDGPDDDQSF